MAYQLPIDVQQSVTEWVASGKYTSEDDVLRDAMRALNEEQDDYEAVREALEELEAGDTGVPLRRAFDELRAKHELSPRES